MPHAFLGISPKTRSITAIAVQQLNAVQSLIVGVSILPLRNESCPASLEDAVSWGHADFNQTFGVSAEEKTPLVDDDLVILGSVAAERAAAGRRVWMTRPASEATNLSNRVQTAVAVTDPYIPTRNGVSALEAGARKVVRQSDGSHEVT